MEKCLKFLPKKSYNKFGYILLVSFALIGTVVIAAATALDSKATLQCNPDENLASDFSTKSYIETHCGLKYSQKFQSSLPLYILIIMNFGVVLLLSIFYAWLVKDRVEIFADPSYAAANGAEDDTQPLPSISKVASDSMARQRNGRYTVFTIYTMHLIVCRIVPLVVFSTMLLKSSNFPVKFPCSWQIQTTSTPNGNSTQSQAWNFSIVDCTYPMGHESENVSAAVVAINSILVAVAFFELAYLFLSSWNDWTFLTDFEFCCVYLLRKRKRIGKVIEKIRENISEDIFKLYDDFGEERCSRRKLKDMYINIIIQEGREKSCLSRRKFKNRHETYEAHFQLPANAYTIARAQDLFKPMSGYQPKTILVVGRPGIGKTLLTKKLLYQWKKQKCNFWHEKIVMVIQFREFNKTDGRTSLQEMLQRHSYGFNMSYTDCNHIHEYICLVPNKAVLIFDGLDELKVDDEALAAEIAIKSHSEVAHVLQIYRKLVKGELLPGVTVLTTSRPTAEHIYLNLEFDREVEVIGFHEAQIKNYVEKFCRDEQKSSKIWDLIKQSPELLGLCYIPVNAYIVCLTLKESIEGEDPKNKENSEVQTCNVLLRTNLQKNKENSDPPRTITELYKRAVNILLFRHHLRYKNKPIPKNYIVGGIPEQFENDLKKLKEIASKGMTENKLIFEFESDDEFAAELTNCGVFNKLEDKRRNIFCFLHLTIQEFLAALHVVDDMNNVESFLSEHIDDPRWHLVIQFVSGLVGDKMREQEEVKQVLER